MRRTVLIALALALIALPAQAEEKTRLSVVTGGTGGVYYPLGGASRTYSPSICRAPWPPRR